MPRTLDRVADVIRDHIHPLTGSASEFDPLMELIGDARFVLLGEATHGTHEFYRARAHITRRLIREKGFSALAVEADWPDAYRVNRFVRGGGDATALEALGSFERFPRWMWRNTDVLALVSWLREHNQALPPARRVGFYGVDLYSLHSSIDAVVAYLERVDPPAAKRARYRYGCFDHFGEDPQAYGYAASFDLERSCAQEVVAQLVELRQRAGDYLNRDGMVAEDELFFAEQNARVARSAEEYYRTMFGGRVSSWNLRDRHMTDTIDALADHLSRRGPAKLVVWAHNSHLGDARATDMGRQGELNVGQLVRERHGGEAVLIGFTTYSGTVAAADDWGDPPQHKTVRPAMEDSYEALLHEVETPDFILPLRRAHAAARALQRPRLERAIGVIYRPQSERISHYFHATLPEQFDAVIHFDETRAVHPLDRTGGWEHAGELPETFPEGV